MVTLEPEVRLHERGTALFGGPDGTHRTTRGLHARVRGCLCAVRGGCGRVDADVGNRWLTPVPCSTSNTRARLGRRWGEGRA